MNHLKSETQIDLQSVYSQLQSLSQQLFTFVLLRRVTAVGRRDMAATLRSLVDRVERIELFVEGV